jgi:hypothetical protein
MAVNLTVRIGVSLAYALLLYPPGANAGTFDNWIRGFAESDIVFERAQSNVPFAPLAYVDASYYGDSEVRRPGEKSLTFDQTSISQAAVLPILMSPRDALLVGEWLGWSEFDSRDSGFDSFDVLSVGLPVGWLHQANPHWQVAGFVMPLGHNADLAGSGWAWEALGGAFGRYVHDDSLWWVFARPFTAGWRFTALLTYPGAGEAPYNADPPGRTQWTQASRYNLYNCNCRLPNPNNNTANINSPPSSGTNPSNISASNDDNNAATRVPLEGPASRRAVRNSTPSPTANTPVRKPVTNKMK